MTVIHNKLRTTYLPMSLKRLMAATLMIPNLAFPMIPLRCPNFVPVFIHILKIIVRSRRLTFRVVRPKFFTDRQRKSTAFSANVIRFIFRSILLRGRRLTMKTVPRKSTQRGRKIPLVFLTVKTFVLRSTVRLRKRPVLVRWVTSVTRRRRTLTSRLTFPTWVLRLVRFWFSKTVYFSKPRPV